MQIPDAITSKQELFVSPVEERHIDYILEEELSLNSEFLSFFLQQARLSATDSSRIVACATTHLFSATRSVTTSDGETDLLVTYTAGDVGLPVAILIEDKIRAPFQPAQAQRYRARGDKGKGIYWSAYWTCLVAHSKYLAKRGDFDAVVTLQSLHSYFASKDDGRSRFRAGVIEQTIQKYEMVGIQRIDAAMTNFRATYAAACEVALDPERWWREPPRDAWWDDNWFLFRGIGWPKGVEVMHMARAGRVLLVLPMRDEFLLRSLVERAAPSTDTFAVSIDLVLVGKAKSAFQIIVPKIKNFSPDGQQFGFEEFLAAVEYLGSFYENSADMLPNALRPLSPQDNSSPEEGAYKRALYAMLLGFMRSAVIQFGSSMPFPLPHLSDLTTKTPEEKRYFASPGLMGGVVLELQEDEEHRPYILSHCSSRQWGTESVRHKISLSEVICLDG